MDLVARALRLIAEGTVDTEGVGGLARRLSVSARHLHRELLGEVGAGPLALARTRRAQTARLLIDQTDLTLTTIAFAAGFASIRQFNETMLEAFGCPPGALRRRNEIGMGRGAVVLRLQYRPPFAHAELLAFLGYRTVPGIEAVVHGVYRRTVKMPRSASRRPVSAHPRRRTGSGRFLPLAKLPKTPRRCAASCTSTLSASVNTSISASPCAERYSRSRSGGG